MKNDPSFIDTVAEIIWWSVSIFTLLFIYVLACAV